jgi:cytosine/adenosine deaminase-related metal-dependent hydrolase
MARLVVKGWYYDPDAEGRFSKGWALFDGPKLIETGKVSTNPPKCTCVSGISLPALPNAHTHLGDYVLKQKVKPGMSIEELVAPPSGLKHKLLPKIDQTESISGALGVLHRSGIGSFCDFREGGLGGIEAMAKAVVSEGHRMGAVILGRPKGLSFDKKEIDDILSKCNGLGISAVRDWDYDALSKLAAHVHKKNKVLALHASEHTHEPIDPILDLGPAFVVHMVKGTPSDFNRLSVLKIPVVVCPQSNQFFGLEPPIKQMLKAGVQVCIGTDNAMLTDLSVLSELKAARHLGLSPLEAWDLIEASWKLLNRKDLLHTDDLSLKWIRAETVTEEPLKALTGTAPRVQVL